MHSAQMYLSFHGFLQGYVLSSRVQAKRLKAEVSGGHDMYVMDIFQYFRLIWCRLYGTRKYKQTFSFRFANNSNTAVVPVKKQ